VTDNAESQLRELERRLRSAGIVVAPFRDHLEIRLPIFASVRVSIADGQLVCEPRFGFVARDRATWATLIGLGAVTAAVLLSQGVTPIALMLGFLSVSSTASTAIRYQLTESAITRVQTAWMMMTAGSLPPQVAPLDRTRANPELGPATPDFRAPPAADSLMQSRPRTKS
jgi:hypothetical protein